MLDRHPDHGIRQPFHVIHITVDRRIAEIQRQHMRQLVKVTFVDALGTQEVEVAEYGRRHFVAVRQAFIGEGGRYRQHAAVAVHHRVRIRANAFRQSLLLQPVGERPRTAVADQVSDQLIGFAAEAIAVVVDAKLDAQHFTRHRRHIVNNDAFLRIGYHRHAYFRPADLTIRHAAKGVSGHARQLPQRLVAVDHRLHQIGGVPAIAEGMQRIKYRAAGLIAERLEVAARKVGRRVSRVNGFCADLGHAHPVSRPGHG